MILQKIDCYRDFLDRLFQNTDDCFILIKQGKYFVEVIWRY